jgi:pilus assembly protein Flp/PilA
MSDRICRLTRFVKGEEGAAMVEYGLILALVALVAIAGLTLLGGNTNTLMSTVGNSV